MKARLISVLLVLALLVTVGVVAAQAAGTRRTLSNIDMANGNAVCAAANAIEFPASGSYVADCPACGCTEVTWEELPTESKTFVSTDDKHYYLPAGTAYANLEGVTYTLNTSAKVCVNLNGQTLKSTTTVFYNNGGTATQLYIMGDGNVQGPADANTIHWNGGYMGLFGGTYGVDNATADTITIPGTYTRRAFCFDGTTVKGTFSATGAGSIHLLGGTYDVVKHTTHHASTGNQHSYEVAGNVKVNKLELASDVTLKFGPMGDNADVKVDASGVFQANAYTDAVTAAAAAEKVTAFSTLHVVEATDAFKLSCNAREGVEICAACGEAAIFTPVAAAPADSALGAGHYRLTAPLTLTTALTVAEDVCVDLNGHNITSTGRVIEQTAGTLNIFGTGTVTGAANDVVGSYGGDAYINAATIKVTGGTLNLKGGEYKHTSASTLPTVNLSSSAIVNMEAGAILTADESVTGPNLYMIAGTFTMNGGEISNGTATNGGNIYQYNGKLYIKGGEIKDGTATATTGGGNIYCRVGGLYMSAGTISGGKAAPTVGEDETVTYEGNGGNIRFQYMAVNTCTINGTAVITGGFAKEGGNIFHNGGTKKLTIEGKAQITEGFAESEGGNIKLLPSVNASENTTAISGSVVISGGEATYGAGIYVEASTEKKDGTEAAVVLNLVGGNYTGGSAINGAFLFQRGGYVNICNGTFTAGNASSKGDLFYLRDGEMLLSGGTMNLGETGDYVVYVGQSSANAPKLVLGKTTSTVTGWLNDLVLDEKATANTVYVNNALAALEVLASFENTATLQLQSPEENPVIPVTNYYGATVQNATAEAFTGKLYLARGDKPEILQDGNGGLVVAGALKDGAWTTTADAFANATESIKLYEDEATVEITESPADIDLNGKSITINGSGVVTAANSDATAASTVTLNGPTLAQTETAVWNTDHFDVVLEGENGAKTVHRLEMRIKSISLRPTTAGLYYTSEIVMDDVLKEQVDEIGVVLAVGDGSVDLSDPASENVKFVGTKEIGSTVNSVLVNNILKDGAENNADRAGWKVQGAAAVIFKGDLGEAVATAENFAQSRSVNDYMDLAYSKFADLSDDNKQGLQDFYNTWKSETGWNYADIESWVAPTPEA